jgi:hypothetical protein
MNLTLHSHLKQNLVLTGLCLGEAMQQTDCLPNDVHNPGGNLDFGI